MNLKEIEERWRKATEGPYAWSYIGEKTNGYIIGVACNEQGELLSGCLDQYEQDEEICDARFVSRWRMRGRNHDHHR